MTGTGTREPSDVGRPAGKYLTFGLADKVYGLEILNVQEIIAMSDLAAVPRTPEFVKGVISLRGRAIPLVDLRLRFGMAEAERTGETCVIVVAVEGAVAGAIVDRVSGVVEIEAEDVEDAPSVGRSVDADFILGMGGAGGGATTLLDIGRALDGAGAAVVEYSPGF